MHEQRLTQAAHPPARSSTRRGRSRRRSRQRGGKNARRRLRARSCRPSARRRGTRRSTSSRRKLLRHQEANTARGALAGFGSAKCSQRGGVPLPEADAGRRSAPTTSITARGSATPRRSRHCWKASAPARSPTSSPTPKHADLILLTGTQHRPQPPGRGHVLQAGGQDAARSSSSSIRAGRTSPTSPTRYCQIRPGTDVAFYNALMHVTDRGGSGRPRLHPRPHRELRRPPATGRELPARARRPGLRHLAPTRSARSPARSAGPRT